MSHLVFPVNHEQWNRTAIQHVVQPGFVICQRQFRLPALGHILNAFHRGDDTALVIADRGGGKVQPLARFWEIVLAFQNPLGQFPFPDAGRVMLNNLA